MMVCKLIFNIIYYIRVYHNIKNYKKVQSFFPGHWLAKMVSHSSLHLVTCMVFAA